MAPRIRIAHTPKFSSIVKTIVDPVYLQDIEAKARSFICSEATEVKFTKVRKTYKRKTVEQSDKQTNTNSDIVQANKNKKYVYNPKFVRTFESRPHTFPKKIEEKIAALVQLLTRPAKKRTHKPKILPIKGINPQNVSIYPPGDKNGDERIYIRHGQW